MAAPALAALVPVAKWAIGVIAAWGAQKGLDYAVDNFDTSWLTGKGTDKLINDKKKENNIALNQAERLEQIKEIGGLAKSENTTVREQLQGVKSDSESMTEWLNSAEGQKWLTAAQSGTYFDKAMEDKEPTPTPTPTPTPEPSIKDDTANNIEMQINWLEQAEKWRQEQWDREDQIRKETQEREDSAYQRAVKDMQKAGINPNLMNVQPASAGGGITQATGIDTSVMQDQMNIDLEKMQQIIDNAFKEDENSKDRFMEVFGEVLKTFGLWILTKGAIKG